jgi:hypothetical protein
MDTKTIIEQFEQEYPTLAKSYKEILKQQYELFALKMSDYGLANIAQGTTLETSEEKKFSLTAVFIRMNDKMSRWKNMLLKNQTPKNETLLDTYRDLTNYAIIAQLVDQDKWKK